MRQQMHGPAENPGSGDDDRQPNQEEATERPRLALLDVVALGVPQFVPFGTRRIQHEEVVHHARPQRQHTEGRTRKS